MSAIHAAASLTANPLMVITRLLLGLFLVWLGVTKLVPGWNNLESDSLVLLSTFTQGKIDPQVGMYVLGGLQVITGLALCVIPALRWSFVLLWVLLAMYVTLAVVHAPELLDNGLPTPLAHLIIRNFLIVLAALSIAAHTIKVSAPTAHKESKK